MERIDGRRGINGGGREFEVENSVLTLNTMETGYSQLITAQRIQTEGE